MSAVKAEMATLFYNTQTAIELMHVLNALGRPQNKIPTETNNETAASYVNATLKR